jgi:hypothetical protein
MHDLIKGAPNSSIRGVDLDIIEGKHAPILGKIGLHIHTKKGDKQFPKLAQSISRGLQKLVTSVPTSNIFFPLYF